MGAKITPGGSFDEFMAFADALPSGVGAVAFVVQDPQLTARLYATDVYTVFAPWSTWPGDCPNMFMSPQASAADRLNYVETMAQGAPFDAIIVSNECQFPSAAYYATWAFAVLDGCDARGWVCIPHVFSSGTPDLDWLPELDDLHCAMQARGHYFGVNVYSVADLPLMSRDGIAPWTTWRWELIKARMHCAPQWMVAELAPGFGYDPPDVGDVAAYIRATWGAFAGVGVWYTSTQPTPIGPAALWRAGDMLRLAELLQ